MNELDMAAIQRRVGSARTWAALQVDLDYSKLPPNLLEHFDRDVPALVDAVCRLEQANADLIAVLGETRAQLHAIGGMQVIEHEGHRLRVITAALHDRLCTVRVGSRQDTTPPVLHCHFCGFCYPPVTGASEQEGTAR